MNTQLSRKFYTKAGIQEAITAYSGLCAIEMTSGGNHFNLVFREVDESVKDVLVDEFNNFALFSSIAGKKTW